MDRSIGERSISRLLVQFYLDKRGKNELELALLLSGLGGHTEKKTKIGENNKNENKMLEIFMQ